MSIGEFVMDEPCYRQAFRWRYLRVIGGQVGHARLFETGVTLVHLGHEFFEPLGRGDLVVNDTAVEVRQPFEREIIDALFGSICMILACSSDI